jgi:hypothetical protein
MVSAATLTGHDVRTVAQAGWSSFENRELLRVAATAFDVITADQNLDFNKTPRPFRWL